MDRTHHPFLAWQLHAAERLDPGRLAVRLVARATMLAPLIPCSALVAWRSPWSSASTGQVEGGDAEEDLRWQRASGGGAKSDAQLQSESKGIVRFQGVALVFLSKVRDDVHSGEVARGVELVVAEEDLSDDVKVAYTDSAVEFRDAQVRPKARVDWTTEDVAEQHVLTLTHRQQAFMLDKIPQAFVGPLFKGVFASQARQCRFGDLVAALEHYFRGQDPAKVFVWLDVFSANQPLLVRPDRELPDEIVAEREALLASGLHEAIQRFDERLIFFDTWDDPAPLRRSWCVWEILGALSGEHRDLRPVFAPGQDDDFLEVLLDDPENVTQAVADIDTRKATCFKAEDKAMITREIERTLTQGFVTLNAVILASLRDWLAEITHAAVEKSRVTEGRSNKHAQVCAQAGYFCWSQSALEQALRYYEEALDIVEEKSGDRHPLVATTLNNIAIMHNAQGMYDDALRFYEEALEIAQENHGNRHPGVATTLNNIGGVYKAQGKYDKALGYLKKALEIRRENLGNRHPDVATTLNNIAAVYERQCKHDEALRHYEEAKKINREKLGDRHPLVATTLGNIGQLYYAQGKYDEALRYFEETLEINREKLGDWHPDVATTLNDIAGVYRAQGIFDEALRYYEDAFAIWLDQFGADHPHTQIAQAGLEECKKHL
ncbi:Kinesin light chain (KLC) [Durusdinium trenchii]|uniref:Kinesin light chain (KLC) n=1 Tax=Durusdinium trenchii TaxID=1381693 RepID=A0ABP0S275_9DINO